MKQTIILLFVIGMMAATACKKDIDWTIINNDTTIVEVNVYGDSIAIRVDGDSIVNNNRFYGGDTEINGGNTEVRGGNTTITNGNNGGVCNDTTVTNSNNGGTDDHSRGNSDLILLKIPVFNFHKAFLYERLENNSSGVTFSTSLPDTTTMLAICFFDATNLEETTLSFPTRIPGHKNDGVYYPTFSTRGKFGADEDRKRKIFALNIDLFGDAEMLDLGCVQEGGINYRALTGDVWISGFEAGNGNNADYATGRTLIGTDGEYVFLYHIKSAKSQEAAQAFENLNVCPPPYAEIAGGSFSNGLKKSPIHFRISYQWLEQN